MSGSPCGRRGRTGDTFGRARAAARPAPSWRGSTPPRSRAPGRRPSRWLRRARPVAGNGCHPPGPGRRGLEPGDRSLHGEHRRVEDVQPVDLLDAGLGDAPGQGLLADLEPADSALLGQLLESASPAMGRRDRGSPPPPPPARTGAAAGFIDAAQAFHQCAPAQIRQDRRRGLVGGVLAQLQVHVGENLDQLRRPAPCRSASRRGRRRAPGAWRILQHLGHHLAVGEHIGQTDPRQVGHARASGGKTTCRSCR